MPACEDHSLAWLSLCTEMKQLSAEAKHHILLEYAPSDATRSFAALARRHAVKGGAQVVRSWHQRWNGTAASLQRKAVTGRPRALSTAQVQQHVRAPILRSNHAHRAIHYSSLAQSVRAATGVSVSDRTVRRYGEEELHAKSKRGRKRTAQECKCRHICARHRACWLRQWSAHEVVHCVGRLSVC